MCLYICWLPRLCKLFKSWVREALGTLVPGTCNACLASLVGIALKTGAAAGVVVKGEFMWFLVERVQQHPGTGRCELCAVLFILDQQDEARAPVPPSVGAFIKAFVVEPTTPHHGYCVSVVFLQLFVVFAHHVHVLVEVERRHLGFGVSYYVVPSVFPWTQHTRVSSAAILLE